MSTTTPDTELTREGRFVGRLAKAHRDRTIGPVLGWHPGALDPRIIALTQDADRDEFIPWTLTAKAYALFHSGRRDPMYGFSGDGIGRWLRRADTNPENAEHLLASFDRATSALELDKALTGLGKLNARSSRFCPHWETLLGELTRWSVPATRHDVRFNWARDYYTYIPAQTAPQTTD